MKRFLRTIIWLVVLSLSVMVLPLTAWAEGDERTALSGELGTRTLSTGSYYLSGDASGNLTISGTVVLDLNGHVLKGAASGAPVICNSGNLTIQDSNADGLTHNFKISGNIGSETTEAATVSVDSLTDYPAATDVVAIYGGVITGGKGYSYGGGIKNTGTLTLTGGTIFGNWVADGAGNWKGGGVYNSGTFNMEDGIIAGNSAYTGGGVQSDGSGKTNMSGGLIIGNFGTLGGGVNNDATFTITGGRITGNRGGAGMGGIRNCRNVTVGGTAYIKNNSDGTNEYNLCGSNAFTVQSGFSGSVGVTSWSTPNPIRNVSTGCDKDYSSCFSSDNSSYVIINNSGNYVALYAPDHTHTWSYYSDGSELGAYCTASASCPYYGTASDHSKAQTAVLIGNDAVYDCQHHGMTLSNLKLGEFVLNESLISYEGTGSTVYGPSTTAPVKVGTYKASYTVIVSGGVVTAAKTFAITPIDFTDTAAISGVEDSYNYSGIEIKPVPTVKIGDLTLTENTDYTVSYSNNKDTGTASVTVTGIGNYKGTVTKNFTIAPEDFSDAAVISGIEASYEYSGKDITPVPTVKIGDLTLVENTDYAVSYSNNKELDTATVTVTGTGNYKGTVTKNFTIVPADFTGTAAISGIEVSYEYSGKDITPAPAVKIGDLTLVENTDYMVSYSNNKELGTATVTVTGTGNYKGTVTKNFTIVPADFTGTAIISGIEVSCDYSGKEITPVPTVKVGDLTLTENNDYTVSYSNNKDAGTASVTVTGKGNYKGTVTKNFTIAPADFTETAVISDIKKSYDYSGEEITPVPTVKIGDLTLVENTDYTVSYSDNKDAGPAKVIVSGIGNYTGRVSASFVIKYAVTDGTDSTWKSGSKDDLTFKGSGTLEKLQSVKIDGVAVNADNYTAKSAPTIIILKNSYLKTLSAGKHTIEIVWTDGTASSDFTVTSGVPGTGDKENVILWMAVMMMAIAGLGCAAACRKKRNNK